MRITVRKLTALAFVLTLGGSAAMAKKHELNLYRDAVVQGVALTAGAYRIEVAPTMKSATIYRGSEPVVSVPCRAGALTEPIQGDSVFYRRQDGGTEEIVRVLLVGPKLAIELGDAPEETPIAKLGAAAK